MNKKVAVLLDINGAYFQKLTKGSSKNVAEGVVVISTTELKTSAKYEQDSEALNEVVAKLKELELDFRLIEIS